MNTTRRSNEKVRRMVTIAMLAALVIVLQALSSVIKFGPFSITLALTPIIIGAALYGVGAGALLGGVFSAYVFVSGLLIDGSLIPMVQYSLFWTIIICFGKGIAAGAVAGLVYKLLAKKSDIAASVTAGVVTPIVNTGIFALGMMSVMFGYLQSSATAYTQAMVDAGEATADYSANPMGFLYLIVIGANFIVEFIVNVALSFAVTRIISAFKKSRA